MKISIITAVRNNKKMIEGCIKSVLGQTYADIEYIIVDGRSQDGTLEIIDRFKGSIAKVISEEDDGIYEALNKGISAATGDVIGFLHSGDLYENENIIGKVAEAFVRNDTGCVYGDLVYVAADDINRIVRYWRAGRCRERSFRTGWMPPHPAFFAKRSVYESFGKFNTDFRIAADYEIMLRFLYRNTASFYYIPEVLVKMRLGGKSNRNLKNIIKKSFEDYKACRMHGLGVTTVIMKNLLKLPQFLLR